MSSAVAELDGVLQSMLNLKPPGVSGSKITSITSLCTANIQSESVLIQKIYTHFKKTPGTHKLGVLYVVDSVTRQWVDQARKSGQQLGSGAPDGTFAAGVHRVTELLPVLMNDIVSSAPEDQKPKIRKLLEIWERSNTFPTPMLTSIKERLDAPASQNAGSTTPINSPTPGFVPLGNQAANQPPAPAQDTSAILEALKNMAKQNTTAQPGVPATVSTPSSLNTFLGAQNGNPLAAGSVNQGSSTPNGQGVNLGALFAGMNNGAQGQQPAAVPANPLAGLFPQQQQQPSAVPNPSQVAPDAQMTLQLVQLMAAQGIPPDQWGIAMQLLNLQNGNGNSNNNGNNNAAGMPFPPPLPANNWAGPGTESRDRDYTRSPPGQGRRRSRSPDRRREVSPRGRRGSPSYEAYRNDGRRGNDYRQRSPMGRKRHSPSPQPTSLPPPGEKHMVFDSNLPRDNIKVLSRTLFVGGVTSSEPHLRSLFAKFGVVQTCIVNVDKRHAFVKMIDRKDAEAARNGMEEYRDGGTQLRTKWGVGFGPRDCSDYQTGISIIPIARLTDADRKWMLTAEYGGTGGKPIQEGMVVEEPDIEIGAGVSSKAMSRRIPTDSGGRRGPQSSRTGGPEDNVAPARNQRYRDDGRRGDSDRPSSSNMNGGNGMANMSFPFANMANGMPMLPPGFNFPFQQNNQN